MYSHQTKPHNKQYTSLVSITSDVHKPIQLKDNRSSSVIQRKLQFAMNAITSNTDVIQLGKKKPKTTTSNALNKNKATKVKKKIKKTPYDRPSFTADSKQSAILHHNTSKRSSFQINPKKPNLPSLNAAQPHRFPWKDMREVTKGYHTGQKKKQFQSMIRFLKTSGDTRIEHIERRLERSKRKKDVSKIKGRTELLKRAKGSQSSFNKAHKEYTDTQNDKTLKEFLRQANSHHANVPDYGAHFGVNQPVNDAIHLNIRKSRSRKRKNSTDLRPRSPSPTSKKLLSELDPGSSEKGIAVDKDGKIITTGGKLIDPSTLSPDIQKKYALFKKTKIKSFMSNAPFGSPYKKST
ncbi:hypothetical protein [Kordia sp.]|uniref:hypothetical protein n=1 Tax=Kordia sp. TaxID=1965332 RepID=UPI003D28F7C2